jgi:hypothetical protein
MRDAHQFVKFGMQKHATFTFSTSGNITSVFSINRQEYMATTAKALVKFEAKEVKQHSHYEFSVAVLIPDTYFIVGLTARTHELTVLHLNDIHRPLLDHYATNHFGVFHIYYSPMSSTLITIGAGVKTWHFKYTKATKNVSIIRPHVSISRRAAFADRYDTAILLGPAFDSRRERLLLPCHDGVVEFDLDGRRLRVFCRTPDPLTTVCAFNPYSRKVVTFDRDNGLRIWSESGRCSRKFDIASSVVFAICFVDRENVVCFNAKHTFFFLNLKTGGRSRASSQTSGPIGSR